MLLDCQILEEADTDVAVGSLHVLALSVQLAVDVAAGDVVVASQLAVLDHSVGVALEVVGGGVLQLGLSHLVDDDGRLTLEAEVCNASDGSGQSLGKAFALGDGASGDERERALEVVGPCSV